MFRQQNSMPTGATLICPDCNGTRFRIQYRNKRPDEVTCINCSYIFTEKAPHGAKAEAYKDLRKPPRTCRQCKKPYYKDRRASPSDWSQTKYCSMKCQSAARRIYATPQAKQEAFRRKKGQLKRGSVESNLKVARLTKLAMQRPEVQEKIRQPKGSLSLEQRMALSDKLVGRMPANLSYDNSGYANIQRGYFDINGTTLYFRSKWEANYALYLDFLADHKEILKWEFEPDTFMFEAIKLGTRSYTPDFKVFKHDGTFEYHEVKGYMDSKSKTKLKRFAKYYPEHKLVLVDKDEYALLKKQIGKLCNFY